MKDLGQEGMATLDDLRARIREGMEHEKKHQSEHKSKEELLEQLTTKFPIDVPTMLVENSIDQRLERGLRSLISQGLRAEDIKRMDLSKLRDGQREGAVRDVRANLLLEKIADLEGIEVTEEDLDQEISAAAQQSKQNPLALRKQLRRRTDWMGFASSYAATGRWIRCTSSPSSQAGKCFAIHRSRRASNISTVLRDSVLPVTELQKGSQSAKEPDNYACADGDRADQQGRARL